MDEKCSFKERVEDACHFPNSNLYVQWNICYFLATKFGIALPKWIVEKQNSMWVSESIQ